MRLYNLTMKVNRLEMLKANIGLELIAGHSELEKFMGGILQGRTMDELQRQAGILGKTIKNNAAKAHAIVNGSFHNATFSDRIWQYQDLMRHDLGKTLQSALIQGKNPRAVAKELQKYWYGNDPRTGGGAVYCMERLMRTELARVQTEAQKQSFERNGFEEYEFIVNGGCCDICQGLSGKHFKVSKMMPGENAPPMHPHCRCSTAAWEDSKEYEAWLDYLDKGGSTEEWNKLQAKQKKVLTKSPKNDNIKESKLVNTKRRGKLPPAMDKTRYEKIVKGLQAHGVTTIEAKGDDLRFLDWLKAEATIGGTTHIYHRGEVPSASALFEEIIHNAQAKRYGVLESTDKEELCIREILANRKMQKYGNRYGFTIEDFEDVERNLAIWEKTYKDLKGVDFDESKIDRAI